MAENATVRVYGLKLLQWHMSRAGGGAKLNYILKGMGPTTLQRCMSGLMIYKNVLWMAMLELKTGKRLPCGTTWFEYSKFIEPFKKNFYRFHCKDGTSSVHSY